MYHISHFAIVLAHFLLYHISHFAYWSTFIHNSMVMACIVYLDLCFELSEVQNV